MTSAGYADLSGDDEFGDLNPWALPDVAAAQRAAVELELDRWRGGCPVAPFDAFRDLLKLCGDVKYVLDVGCGVGHYRFLVKEHCPSAQYFGLDNSPAMLDQAFRWHDQDPTGARWVLGSACEMGMVRGEFDLVIDGSALLHERHWEDAIAEYKRISVRWIMLHRTAYTLDGSFKRYRKEAYGQPCYEQHFAASEILRIMSPWALVSEVVLPCEHWYQMSSTIWKSPKS